MNVAITTKPARSRHHNAAEMIKREAEDTNGSSTPTDASVKRRKVLDELSEEGPLTQEDVVYYQKEAIFRQLHQYKQRFFLLTKEHKLVETELDQYKNRLLVLNAWIDQFVEFVFELGSVDAKTGASAADELKLFLEVPSVLESDEFIKTVEQKRDRLGSLIDTMCSKLPSDVPSNMATINKEYQNVKVKYNALKSEHSLVKQKYQSIDSEYQKLLKDHQRLQSKTIPRVLGQKEEATPAPAESVKKEQEDTKDTEKQTASKTSTPQPTKQVDEEQLHSLQAQVDEYKAVIEAQKASLNEAIAKFSLLSKGSHSGVTEDDITSSDQYKTLQKQNEELQNKQMEFLQKFEALETQLKDSNEQIKSHQETMEVFNKSKADLEAKLIETKEKEERLRNERDLAIAEGDVWKQKNSMKVLADMQELIKSQELQIKSFSLEEKLKEVIPSDVEDVETLKKKNALLINEIKELETAFKQLQSVRIPKIFAAGEEEKRKKDLEAAKTKVDHKYRTLMQGDHYTNVNKEKLETSFKVLKTGFEKLEAGQIEYKKQIETLKNEIATLKSAQHIKELEAKEYRKRADKFEDKLKSEALRAEGAQQELQTVKQQYQNILQANSDLSQDAAAYKSKCASQEKQIQRFKQTGSTEDASEIDSFRSLIYCSLCSKNWKNTAIKSCGHVFCESCAKERLAARMRKCPSCNKQFSSNDLLTIHL